MRRLAFNLAILFLSFQLGYHFWPSYSFLAGYRIDYLSPTIYLSYLFIFLYILVCLPTTLAVFRNKFPSLWKNITLFLLLIILNCAFAVAPVVALLAWLKFIFYLFFLISLLTEEKLYLRLVPPLIYSLVVVLALEFIQFISQSSINGLAYFLGERNFNLATPNIAKIDLIFLHKEIYFIRPYSTFSHPNSLAGFLLISFLLLNRQSLRSPLKILLIIGIFLTFSKAAIAALLIVSIYQTLLNKNKTIARWLYILSFLSAILISLAPLLSTLSQSFASSFNLSSSLLTRLNLGRSTLSLIQDRWLVGSGLNNYLVALTPTLIPSKTFFATLQPVHSTPLLAFVEIGLLGTITILYSLRKFISQIFINNEGFKITILALLITSSLDHYWWTLVQNQLLLVVVFALYYTHAFRKKSK